MIVLIANNFYIFYRITVIFLKNYLDYKSGFDIIHCMYVNCVCVLRMVQHSPKCHQNE